MKNNRQNELEILREELQYNKNYFYYFENKEQKKIKTNKKAKLIIFKNIKKIFNDNLKLEEKIKNEIIDFIKSLIQNKKKSIEEIKELSDFEVSKNYNDAKSLKDLKKGFQYPVLSKQTNILLNKELKSLIKNQKIIERKKSKYTQKEKKNMIDKYFIKKIEIKEIKNKIRIKDVNSLIQNKSTYRKLYLSDEIPLTPTGWIKLFISYGLLIFWALIILWPLGELVKATLNNNAKPYLNTNSYEFGFDSFKRLFNTTLYTTWMSNTILISLITSSVTVFTALLMGYAFSRFRFKGRKTSLLSIMLLQMIPTLSALTVFYVLYTILKSEYQVSGLTVLMLIYIGGGIAGNTFIIKGYMDSISIDIDEAAKIDGLSQWKIFTRIIAPLTKPMIALVGLWSFIGPFGDYILPALLITKDEEFTLAQGIRILIRDSKKMDQGAFAAGAILIAVPISILFISLRKFLIGGITAGGVKG